MSDERFDRDLRSVLDEDAPHSLPEDLRRRVAAISATDPIGVPPTVPIWRRPIPVGFGVLAAAAIVIAVGLSRPVPSRPDGVGATPGATTTPATATATASGSASTAVTGCDGADLAGRILDWQGAAGSRIADIEITNDSARPCTVRGTPGLQLIDAHGQVFMDSATAGASGRPHVGSGDPSFEVAPGGTLRTMVAASNYCGADPTLPVRIGFTLPSGRGSFAAAPGTGVSSDEAVPPCMGSAGAQLTMNGWRR